jgi:hypothetical protein
MMSSMTFQSVLLALLASQCTAQYLQETSFKNIEYGKPNTVTVLYWLNDPSTDAKSRAALAATEAVAQVFVPLHVSHMPRRGEHLLLQKYAQQYPQVQWIKCDAASNYQDIVAAQIEKKMVPIVVVAIDGVVLVNAENDVNEQMLTQLIVEGYAPPQSNDVFGFSSEDVLLGVSQQASHFS